MNCARLFRTSRTFSRTKLKSREFGSVKEGDGAVGGPGDGGVGVVLQAPKHGTRDGGWVGERLQALHSQHGEAGRFSANNHKIRERN